MSLQKPKGWPAEIKYLRQYDYTKAFTREQQQKLLRDKSSPSLPASAVFTISASSRPSQLVRIQSIADKSHPAFGQRGLFAARPLAPDTLVVDYLGAVHSAADANPASDYDLSLDREGGGVGVDAARAGNEARFVNDYRSTGAAGPNAEFREVWVDVGRGRAQRRMAVFVLPAGKSGRRARGIARGEEVLVSYGKGFWKERRAAEEEEEEGGRGTEEAAGEGRGRTSE